jgi:hypothetical protein
MSQPAGASSSMERRRRLDTCKLAFHRVELKLLLQAKKEGIQVGKFDRGKTHIANAMQKGITLMERHPGYSQKECADLE